MTYLDERGVICNQHKQLFQIYKENHSLPDIYWLKISLDELAYGQTSEQLLIFRITLKNLAPGLKIWKVFLLPPKLSSYATMRKLLVLLRECPNQLVLKCRAILLLLSTNWSLALCSSSPFAQFQFQVIYESI